MAKKDFIERENRTTIVGVIGIVVIVILVASYMEIQQIAFFAPEEENLAGLSTETFMGVRHVRLESHEAFVTHLTTKDLGSRSYYLYPTEKLLVIDQGDSYEQIIMKENNGLYSGSYNDQGTVNVLVNPDVYQIVIDGLVSNLPPLALTPLKIFDGTLSVAGEEYYFRLLSNELLITGTDTRETIMLAPEDGLLNGMWGESKIILNPEDNVIIVNNIY